MRSLAPPERALAGAGAWGRRRLLIPATAVIGAAVGASAAIWLRFDRSGAARAIVAAGLFAAAALAAAIAVRLNEQRRWHMLAEKVAHATMAGYAGGLAAQAEAARRFVGADGAAIVWTDDPRGAAAAGDGRAARVAATAGSVPDGFVTGAHLLLPDRSPAPRWATLADEDPCAVPGRKIAVRRLNLGPARSGAVIVWSSRPGWWAVRRLGRAARVGSNAIERARLDDAERRSRLGASHARRHLAMLVSASATLARAIDDWQPPFSALAAEIVPLHADYFALDVADEQGGVRREASAHIDPGMAHAAQAARATLDGARSLLLLQGEGRAAELAALELEALAIIPIRGRTSVVGAVSVGTQAPRRGLRPSDVEAYEELAARCAQAIERVRLYRETQSAARSAQVNEQRLQALFEASPLAIIEVDNAGQLRSANAAAAALFRWGGPPAPRTLPGEVTEAFAALRARVAAGHAVVADRITVARQDGSSTSLSVAAAIVPHRADAEQDLVCIFTDVTQRELLEREVQQKQRMEALGRMAGGVAHDFNNLLTVIVGYSDLLAARLGHDDPSYGDVDAIRVAGQQAAAFTEQLLTISNTHRGDVHTVDLAHAVRNLEPVLRRLVGDDVTLLIECAPGSGWVAIDEGQLEQVILNLVVNARDAMPDGGTVSITASTAATGDIELVVRDTGVGMDTATLERCFDPFFTTKGRAKGTGLGLATVYGIVDHAGGEITVESAVGAGTTFCVRFSAAPRREPAEATPPEGPPPGRANGEDRELLLVEDDAEVRAYARRVLTDAGYVVVEAAGSAEALAVAATLGRAPAILVTDVLMPGSSGPEVAAALRAAHPSLPVVFVSGFVEDAERAELLHGTPASAFLAKPFTPADLLAAVGTALASGAGQR